MTSSTGDEVISEWLPYFAKLVFRDLVPVADPYHADELRKRDREIFESYGPSCRRPLPGEFTTQTMARLSVSSLVVVDFSAGRWQRADYRLQERLGRVSVHRCRGQCRPDRVAGSDRQNDAASYDASGLDVAELFARRNQTRNGHLGGLADRHLDLRVGEGHADSPDI